MDLPKRAERFNNERRHKQIIEQIKTAGGSDGPSIETHDAGAAHNDQRTRGNKTMADGTTDLTRRKILGNGDGNGGRFSVNCLNIAPTNEMADSAAGGAYDGQDGRDDDVLSEGSSDYEGYLEGSGSQGDLEDSKSEDNSFTEALQEGDSESEGDVIVPGEKFPDPSKVTPIQDQAGLFRAVPANYDLKQDVAAYEDAEALLSKTGWDSPPTIARKREVE